MGKVRVYELAKELNTTSKRLMEKLAEINVKVKNHMSLLEDHELDALYKHIGVINHSENKTEPESKKAAPPMPVQQKPEIKKDRKSAPRIIRTTEIIINSRNDDGNTSRSSGGDSLRGNFRGSKNSIKHDYVKSSDANTGLRAGFIRASKNDYIKALNKQQNKDAIEVPADVSENKKNEKPLLNATEKASVSDIKQAVPVNKTEDKAMTKEEAIAEIKNEMPAENTDKVAAIKEEKTEMIDKISVAKTGKVQKDKLTGEKAKKEKKTVKNDTITQAGNAAAKKDNSESPQPKSDTNQEDTADGKKMHDAADSSQARGSQPDNTFIQTGRVEKIYHPDSKALGEKSKEYGAKPKDERFRSQTKKQQGDRTQSQSGRTQGQSGRTQGQSDRTQGQSGRTQGQSERTQGQSERTQGQSGRTQGQSERTQGQSGRTQGQSGRVQNRSGRQQQYAGNKQGAGYRTAAKPLDIPKPDLTIAQKDELGSQRNEARREFVNKDIDKDTKREQRKESQKSQTTGKNKKFKPNTIVLSEKKGISEVLSEDFILNEFYEDNDLKKKKQNRLRKDKLASTQPKHIPQRAVLTSIKISESITVKELAEALKKTSAEIIKKLMGYGIMATLNQEVDFDTATIVADEFGVKTEKEIVINDEDILFDDTEDDPSKLVPRPPVVVVMGHVDHGKTSLLDAIKSTHVIDTEAGGITQHIGAYTVKIKDRNITFLDTPGHEAFTAMRARGAQVTDIAILVVAADDGVMPQTVEAINHAKAANVTIIVAINKIDKPGANPDRVKQELVQHGLVSEEWGGDVICVNVSAKKRENIDQLLEMVLLSADMLELKANPERQAKGTIIEAKLDKNRGPLATMLVQRGTLKVGDSIVAGTTTGRIRAMLDDKGNYVKDAGPSTPVEILGLSEVPEGGEVFYAIEDEKVAKHLVGNRKHKLKQQQMNKTSKITLEDLYKQIQEGQVKELNIIVKADVQGSVEAVKQSLEKLSNDEVRVNIIHGGVGAITETDVVFADVSNAIIIGFNVRPGPNVTEAAQNTGVDLRLYSVIYNAIEDIESAMKGMLDPTFKEVVLGHTEIRQIFKASSVGSIAGCYVLDGKINRNSDIRVIRDGIVVHEGKLASLKRFKDDAKEVLQGFECGLSIERFNDIKENDIIEAYTMEEVKR